jgi:hypothetical protein
MKFEPIAYVARIVAPLVPVLLLGAGEAIGGYNAPTSAGAEASSSGIGMIAVLLILGAFVIGRRGDLRVKKKEAADS